YPRHVRSRPGGLRHQFLRTSSGLSRCGGPRVRSNSAPAAPGDDGPADESARGSPMTGNARVSLLVAAVAPLLTWGGQAGAQGAEFALNCRADEVLVGISGRQGWWMDAIAARCRTVAADGMLATAVRTTPSRGGTGGTQRTFQCGRQEV